MYPYLHIFGRELPVYSLCIITGVFAAWLIARRRSRKRDLSTDHLLIITAVTVGMAVAGAKILYLLVSVPPSVFWDQIKAGDFTLINGGGLVFYGGLIGGIAGAFLGAKIAGARLLDYESAIVPCIPLGHAFGRIGCFMAGCCYGIPYDGPFSVRYPNSAAGLSPEVSVFPVQLLEALINTAVFLFLIFYAGKPRKSLDLIVLYLLIYGTERFFLEYLRGDMVRGHFAQLSTSQWISAGIVLLCGIYLCVFRKRAKRINSTLL